MVTPGEIAPVRLPPALAAAGAASAALLEARYQEQVKAFAQQQERQWQVLLTQQQRAAQRLAHLEAARSAVARASGVDLEHLQAADRAQLQQRQQAVLGLKPTVTRPAVGAAGIARTPPYDVTYVWHTAQGVVPTQTFQANVDGTLGINAGCLEPGGVVSGMAAVGVWYYAPSAGWLLVQAQGFLDGAAEADSIGLPWPMGYVSNVSDLRVGAWAGGTFWAGGNDYIDVSGIEVNQFSTYAGTPLGASVFLPVAAGQWYLLWAVHDTAQGASGLASAAVNVSLYVSQLIAQLF